MRSPCCSDDANLKKGPWTPEEDQKLIDFINIHGCGSWRALPKLAGLNRCGKSCRLRWTNYLRPDIKRGQFTDQEERIIIDLHAALGNKWSKIASHLPGRTDNEIKNFWNTHIRKKFLQMGIDPNTHKPRTDLNQLLNLSQIISAAQFGNLLNPWDNFALRLQTDATHLAKLQLLQNLLQIMNTNTPIPNIDSTSTLLGSQNLNPFQGLINKTYIKEPDLLQPSHDHSFLNQGLNSQAATANEQLQALADSWTCLENLDVVDNNTVIQPDNTLPPLISSASADQTTTVSQTKSKDSTVQLFTSSSPVSSGFEDWEKLLNIDDTSGSYWKNMLEFTSTPSSPISW